MTSCRSMDCWRGTSQPRVSEWRLSMLQPCDSPSCRVSLGDGAGDVVEFFRADADRGKDDS
jgi:hypothetical protein